MYKELGCIRNGFCMIFFLQEKVKNRNTKTPNPIYYFEPVLVVALLGKAAVSLNGKVKGEDNLMLYCLSCCKM